MTFVNLSWYDPQAYISDVGEYVISKVSNTNQDSEGSETSEGSGGSGEATGATQDSQATQVIQATPIYELRTTNSELIERIGAYNSLFVANLQAGSIDASQITLSGTNLEERLKSLEAKEEEQGEGILEQVKTLIEEAIQNLTAKTAQIAQAIIENLTVKENLTLNAGIRGVNVLVEAGAVNLAVKLDPAQPDANYAVSVSPSWLTSYSVTAKAVDSFTINFSTPAPEGATADWIIVR